MMDKVHELDDSKCGCMAVRIVYIYMCKSANLLHKQTLIKVLIWGTTISKTSSHDAPCWMLNNIYITPLQLILETQNLEMNTSFFCTTKGPCLKQLISSLCAYPRCVN